MKISHQIFTSSRPSVADEQARILRNWRHVIEQIVQSTGLDLRCGGVERCIRIALSCGPLGFSDVLKTEDKLSKKQKQELDSWTKYKGDKDCITAKCQSVLFDVLISQKFALLCNLLCESFSCIYANVITDLTVLISKMHDGVYEQSFELFNKDMLLVWDNFHKFGQEMSSLADRLLRVSQALCQKQENLHTIEEVSVGCETKLQSPDINYSSKNEPIDARYSYLDKVSTCKQCCTEAHAKCCLICDGCEAMFHLTCIKPAVKEINNSSWYCDTCAQKRKPPEFCMTAGHLKRHHNCVVCHKLDDLESRGIIAKPEVGLTSSRSRKCPVSVVESVDLPKPSSTAKLKLCKYCLTCENDDKKFIICSNLGCLYVYYHIDCLKKSPLAIDHQSRDRWYCPSCLCRSCVTDKDDELIVMCDNCDEGYHTYCMNPPRDSIPEGQWFCFRCNLVKIRKKMRMFEQSLLQKHGQGAVRPPESDLGSMEMLVNAAEKLSTQEKLVRTTRKQR